ncbi:hypothetical protein SCLCIDRAFT_1214636 [Scleroderma citrinum Foug A]|uniref:BPL/LPL catalytic domain-containing protein n=1 Tax=Scleroderma citrinum Foug A TaxID=1036808 RepID=A0A0C3AD35_9AGAM|nr:hypothetical protein SCLCIDRAFT_1214636 [Scleroderma citrinum Foug A]
MDILLYPASPLIELLTSLADPHYLPQILSTSALTAAPAYPWHSTCALLVLAGPPPDHTAVRKYVELGGRVLALGAGVKRPLGIDESFLRISDGVTSLCVDFYNQTPTQETVRFDGAQIPVPRIPSATLDVDADRVKILARFASDNSPAGVLSEGGRIAVWSCPSLHETLLRATLIALGLRLGTQGQSSSILPQLLLAHPQNWKVQERILQSLFPERALSSLTIEEGGGNASPQSTQGMVFSDEANSFHFHVLGESPPERNCEEKDRDILLPKKPLTPEQEQLHTPLFSSSVFFSALDEFRDKEESNRASTWRIGDALLYGEVVTSTQSMLEKNPKFLRALPAPIVSFASKQIAGRGRGANAWISPAGCMLVSLTLRVPVKNTPSAASPDRFIRTSNLVFIQYLFAIAVADACRAIDPSRKWANRVKLKWPNDIYGEFPSQDTWKKTELKKIGGILVNLNFGDGTVDIVVGCGLNILNEPPVASLAQLAALADHDTQEPSNLRVKRVTAAILAAFERIWSSFLENEELGFEPFLDRYTSDWVHSNQIVTLTTTTPHTTVRVESITTDHGLLRTVPLSNAQGSQYIDLQPDGNSFDMMKGLIKMKGM